MPQFRNSSARDRGNAAGASERNSELSYRQAVAGLNGQCDSEGPYHLEIEKRPDGTYRVVKKREHQWVIDQYNRAQQVQRSLFPSPSQNNIQPHPNHMDHGHGNQFVVVANMRRPQQFVQARPPPVNYPVAQDQQPPMPECSEAGIPSVNYHTTQGQQPSVLDGSEAGPPVMNYHVAQAQQPPMPEGDVDHTTLPDQSTSNPAALTTGVDNAATSSTALGASSGDILNFTYNDMFGMNSMESGSTMSPANPSFPLGFSQSTIDNSLTSTSWGF